MINSKDSYLYLIETSETIELCEKKSLSSFKNVIKKMCLEINRLMGLAGRVFANGPGHQGSIPGRVMPKTLKMVLDT